MAPSVIAPYIFRGGPRHFTLLPRQAIACKTTKEISRLVVTMYDDAIVREQSFDCKRRIGDSKAPAGQDFH